MVRRCSNRRFSTLIEIKAAWWMKELFQRAEGVLCLSSNNKPGLTVVPNVPAGPSDLERLLGQHGELDALCRLLEEIADDLPQPCPSRCAQAVEQLTTLVAAHHAAEEPVLGALMADQALFARVFVQHCEDEGLAHELVLALEPLCKGQAAPAPETLGYMLRCFFTSYRRAMLIEELAIQAFAA